LKSKRYLRNDRVSLDNTKQKVESFSKSKNRVKACFDIAQVEYGIRKKWMRLVILSDFIRDEKFQLSLNDTDIQTGAYPIFHYFIHNLEPKLALKTVLLTGRLCIVPKNLVSKISEHIDDGLELITKNYSEHDEFYCVNTNSHQLTKALTKLHQNGDVTILIGTRSLLGEGWDAPHVNSLIMATQTGAFVTTNQLRGRAIRVDRNDELKTASIWHIISHTDDSICNKLIFQDLNKRFKTFAGLHAENLTIESGISRLLVFEEEIDSEHEEIGLIDRSNQMMSQRLENDVFSLKARWQNALEKSEEYKLISGLHYKNSKTSKNVINRYTAKVEAMVHRKSKTLKYLAFASIGLSPILYPFVPLVPLAMASMMSATSLTLGKLFLDSKPQYFASYYSNRFADIVLASLINLSRIKQDKDDSKKVNIENIKNGNFRFSLMNATHKENNLFLEALGQLLDPIKIARYIICLNDKPAIDEVFAVPHIFGVNKKSANIFHHAWCRALPEYRNCRLISTASEQGRMLLLKLQAQNIVQQQLESESVRLVERWQ
jgi:hypothetical protein